MIRIQCPAKVNLFLEVTGRRPDGYHRLATLFAKINLYDVLELETAPGGVALEVLRRRCARSPAARKPGLPGRRDFPQGLPSGRRGAKSSCTNASPGRRPGRRLLGRGRDLSGWPNFWTAPGRRAKAELRRMAVSLGADVPFFLHPAPFCLGRASASGSQPVQDGRSLPYMVLAYPGLHVSTAEAYGPCPPAPRSVRVDTTFPA